ncbi:MAG: hypothetical protein M3Y68_11025, partial [Chloroflexota bacterium]|nr:hypothetical protein [Chloroflexota bacterium]
MAANRVGRGLIIAGIGGIVLALLTAILFHERENIRSVQILMIEVALLAIIGGIVLARTATTNGIQGRHIVNPVLDFPIIVWILIGFLVVYILLFLFPVFLSPALTMNYLAGYIPNL